MVVGRPPTMRGEVRPPSVYAVRPAATPWYGQPHPPSLIPAAGPGKTGEGPRCGDGPANRTMAAMSTFAAPRPAPRPLDPERLASHMERLIRVARHLTGRHGDAEDLVQDTFERVLRRPRTVSGSRRPTSCRPCATRTSAPALRRQPGAHHRAARGLRARRHRRRGPPDERPARSRGARRGGRAAQGLPRGSRPRRRSRLPRRRGRARARHRRGHAAQPSLPGPRAGGPRVRSVGPCPAR